MTATRFWMVWRPDASTPTTRHQTDTDAYAEANRLALRHPGAEFFVLEAVGHVRGTIRVESSALDPVGLLKRAPSTGPAVFTCPVCLMPQSAHVGGTLCTPAARAAAQAPPVIARLRRRWVLWRRRATRRDRQWQHYGARCWYGMRLRMRVQLEAGHALVENRARIDAAYADARAAEALAMLTWRGR